MRQKIGELWRLLRDRKQMGRYLGWLGKHTRPFLPSLALMTLVDLMLIAVGFLSSFISEEVVDTATAGLDYRRAFLIMVCVTVFSIGVGAVMSVFRAMVNERFSFGIRMKVFDRILSADYLGLSGYHSGDLLTRLTSDADTVANSIASAVPSLAMIFVRLIAAFILLYGYAPTLALSALALAPAGMIVALAMGQRIKKLAAEMKETEAAYRSFLQEHTANIAVVKTFCMEERSRARMAELRRKRMDAVLRRNRLGVISGTAIRCLFTLGYLISFAYCVAGLHSGTFTYGTMTLFLTLFSQIQQPLVSLSHLLPQAFGVLASAGRIMELEAIPEDPRTGHAEMPKRVSLRFEGVSFSYGRQNVLKNVSFTLEAGQLIGIMGPSGVGKTTLVRLALALMRPDAGSLVFLYDGKEETVSADSRRLIGYVPQGNTLISGTIRDNLLWGKPGADDGEMLRALDAADAGFVRGLPQGLDTGLGEKAAGLSEGQAQRIAIARAFLRETPVLVLDEATSALDEKSEKAILSGLSSPERGWRPLCLIITHRSSMRPYFDRLIEIREDGSCAVSAAASAPRAPEHEEE